MNKLNTVFVMKGSGVRVPVSAQEAEEKDCIIDVTFLPLLSCCDLYLIIIRDIWKKRA